MHIGCTFARNGVLHPGSGSYGQGTSYYSSVSDVHTMYSWVTVDSAVPAGTWSFTVHCINSGSDQASLPNQNGQGQGFFMVEEL